MVQEHGSDMSRMAIKVVLAMLACAWAGASAVRSAESNAAAAPGARAVMDKAIADELAILRDKTLSVEQKRQKVEQIAYANISFEVMARLSLGRFVRGLTDAQRTEYQAAFKELVTNTYGVTIDSYTDQDVKIVGDRQESGDDWTVETRIVSPNDEKTIKEGTKVDYRLRKQDNQWKVIDFTAEGVSLVANFRSQFQEIMSNGGIDQLLKLLRDKNAAKGR